MPAGLSAVRVALVVLVELADGLALRSPPEHDPALVAASMQRI